MYVPDHFALDQDACVDILTRAGAADLVTTGPDGPDATLLPLRYVPTDGTPGSLVGHVARNNPQAKGSTDGRALVIAHDGDHYVSPTDLPSHADHGRVVPTWDYVTVHAFGRLVLHDDPDWLLATMTDLTDHHEATWLGPDATPWRIADAPTDYIRRMLRAVVGVEVRIDRLVGKAKLSQNKTPEDVAAQIDALDARGLTRLADLKRDVSLPAAHRRRALLDDVARRRTARPTDT